MMYLTEQKKYEKMEEFKSKLYEMIDDVNFLKKIKVLLQMVDSSKVKFIDNGFVYKNFCRKLVITVKMDDNNIYYKAEFPNDVITITYHKDDSLKKYIKYTTKKTTVFNNVFKGEKNRLYDSYNIEETTKFHTYDENGFEIWYLEEEKHDNYFQNKLTKEQIIHDPSCFENYLKKEYLFRENDGIIIKRIITQYKHEENEMDIRNRDCYLIKENSNPNEKYLSKGGLYVGIPKEQFAKYKLKKCTSSELWKSRVRVRGMDVHYI